jgi:hypothetical protein
MKRSETVWQLIDLSLVHFNDLVYFVWVAVDAGLVKGRPILNFVAVI